MNFDSERRRPAAVPVIACLFIAVGALGIVHHFPRSAALHPAAPSSELAALLAVVAGAFLLWGKGWARWLALAWIAFHLFNSWPDPHRVAGYTLILAATAWLLTEPEARRYFARRRGSATGTV